MTRDASAPLDFLTERDDRTGSWERSDPLHAVIRPHSGDRYDVKLPDGDYHDVRLHRENGAWFGTCDCKGYEYGDDRSPCAHLCSLRRAHWCAENQPSDPAATDLYGNLVHVPSLEEIDDQRDTDPAPEARADGGREPIKRPSDLQTEPRWTGR